MPVHEAVAGGGAGIVKAAGSRASRAEMLPVGTAGAAVAEDGALVPASVDEAVSAGDATTPGGEAVGELHGLAMAMPTSTVTSTATTSSTRRRQTPPWLTTRRTGGGSVIRRVYAFTARAVVQGAAGSHRSVG